MVKVGSLIDLVYPRVCAGCNRPVYEESAHVCWDCMAGFEIIQEPFCSICGDPADGMVEHEYICSMCRGKSRFFDLARSAVRYRGSLRSVLHSFKYERATCLTYDFVPFLSACVNTHYSDVNFDAVVCVPLYSKKERERTYNQSVLLAGSLAGSLGLPFFRRAISRIKDTRTQTDLSFSERCINVRRAFNTTAREWVEGRTVLLVDDVMTTGATVSACSRVLKEAGAAGVYVVTVARG
ncbi:double zinc ribbon domain-containing protein [Verrucomicrobiota bacterium]